MKKTVFIMLLLFAFSGCEKDDICDANTSTTPQLVIEFFEFKTPTLLKPVTNLKVNVTGQTEAIPFNPTGTTVTKYLTSASKIKIPLNTQTIFTKFTFTLFSDYTINPALINVDELQFDYTTSDIFVSRACGFKKNFTLSPTNPFTHTDAISDGKWIKGIIVTKSLIENDNETHIKIYF